MAAFGGAGLLSIVPTRQYALWREQSAAGAAPSIEETAHVAVLRDCGELVLFPAIPICVALMTRGIGV